MACVDLNELEQQTLFNKFTVHLFIALFIIAECLESWVAGLHGLLSPPSPPGRTLSICDW